jgi:2-amino-4-hydroxy-6-hydroxymethyldihydropteridine diphosphokinase
MPDVYVGLGSNADAERRIAAALADLRARFGTVRCSSLYRSADAAGGALDYLNAAAAFASGEPLATVRAVLAGLEGAAGRIRPNAPGAPCPLDLDLLLYGDAVDGEARLPRADVLARAFVLAPLAELAPRLRHPVTGEAFAAAWERVARSAAGAMPARHDSPADAAAAVDGDDVPRHVGGVAHEE